MTNTKLNLTDTQIRRLFDANSKLNTKQIAEKHQLPYRPLLKKANELKLITKSPYLSKQGQHLIAEAMLRHPNKTTTQLANQFGVSATTIYRIRKKYNIPNTQKHQKTNTKKEKKQFLQKLKQLIKLHPEYQISELAIALHVSESRISKYINQYNLQYESKRNINSIFNIQPTTLLNLINNHPNKPNTYYIKQLGTNEKSFYKYIKQHPTIKNYLHQQQKKERSE